MARTISVGNDSFTTIDERPQLEPRAVGGILGRGKTSLRLAIEQLQVGEILQVDRSFGNLAATKNPLASVKGMTGNVREHTRGADFSVAWALGKTPIVIERLPDRPL